MHTASPTSNLPFTHARSSSLTVALFVPLTLGAYIFHPYRHQPNSAMSFHGGVALSYLSVFCAITAVPPLSTRIV